MVDAQACRAVERVTVGPCAVWSIIRIEIPSVAPARPRGNRPWSRIAAVFQAEGRTKVGALVAVRGGGLPLVVAIGVSVAGAHAGPHAERAQPKSFTQLCRHVPHWLDPVTRRHHAEEVRTIGLRAGPLGAEDGVRHGGNRCRHRSLRRNHLRRSCRAGQKGAKMAGGLRHGSPPY